MLRLTRTLGGAARAGQNAMRAAASLGAAGSAASAATTGVRTASRWLAGMLPQQRSAAAAAASCGKSSMVGGSGGLGWCGLLAQRAGLRCLSSAAAAEPTEAPKKARKAVTWYGARISTDPTAPSVIRRRPTTPSQRHTAITDKTYLWRGPPVKSLTKGIKRSGARNNQGLTTVWGKGGGNKRRYRLIDFQRAHPKSTGVVTGTVERIEYDPNRTALIALLRHSQSDEGFEGEKHAALSYIVCPRGIAVGNELQASRTQLLDVKPGNSMLLRHMPVGTLVHNIELRPGQCAPHLRAQRRVRTLCAPASSKP